MACTACRITIDKKKGSAVPILKGTEDQHFTWIVLTQELYVSLGLSGAHINKIDGGKRKRVSDE